MSHILQVRTRPGHPQIRNLAALRMGCTQLGLLIQEGSSYRTWATDNQQYSPSQDMLGRDATFVISCNEEQKARFRAKYNKEPYELGVCPDPNNPGCYVLRADPYFSGYGLMEIVGAPIFDTKNTEQIETFAPKLMMHYQMACVKLAAQEQGDEISWQEQQDGSWLASSEPDPERMRV